MTEATETQEIKVPILTRIQNELKAPKSQYNSFGKYNYRNAEDIESALKPLLYRYGATLYIDEDVRIVGDRVYIVAIVKYKDSEQEVETHGFAREALNKKGMDDSQITGATSSYAIKYALGKLFLIDDTRDADSARNSSQSQARTQASRKVKPVSEWSLNELKSYAVTFNGKRTNMAIVHKYASEGNEAAKQCVKGFNDAQAKVFVELEKRLSKQG